MSRGLTRLENRRPFLNALFFDFGRRLQRKQQEACSGSPSLESDTYDKQLQSFVRFFRIS